MCIIQDLFEYYGTVVETKKFNVELGSQVTYYQIKYNKEWIEMWICNFYI